MGTVHAWESFGDGATPDIQAVAKGLGGGYVSAFLFLQQHITYHLALTATRLLGLY